MTEVHPLNRSCWLQFTNAPTESDARGCIPNLQEAPRRLIQEHQRHPFGLRDIAPLRGTTCRLCAYLQPVSHILCWLDAHPSVDNSRTDTGRGRAML
jgi:hypothetical protein